MVTQQICHGYPTNLPWLPNKPAMDTQQICHGYPTNLPWIPNKSAMVTQQICHGYPANFSKCNYKIPKTARSESKFRISFRGPSIWNNVLQNSEKETESVPLFKSKLKLKLLSFNNKIKYF